MLTTFSSTFQFPAIAQIKIAMESAGTSIKAAEYLQSQIQRIADNTKAINKSPDLREKADNVIAAVAKFTDYVRFKLSSSDQPWKGEKVASSDQENILKNIANAAFKGMEGKLTNIKLDYAVSEKGHFMRGYSKENDVLDEDSVKIMDKLFNGWLAEKGYGMHDGYLNKDGNQASAAEVEELLNDGSMQQYMDKKGVSNLTMQTRDYPDEQKEAKLKRTVETAVEQTNPSNEKSTIEQETQQPGTHN